MMKINTKLLLVLCFLVMVCALPDVGTKAQYQEIIMITTPTPNSLQSNAAEQIFLPLVANSISSNPSPSLSSVRRINVPYFNVTDVTAERFNEMSIFWFGHVSPSENYIDVRTGYNDQDIEVYLAVFDRRLWYDTTPTISDLSNWDSATLYLNLSGNSGETPSTASYRFDAQLNWYESRSNYQSAYQGNGSDWTQTNLAFESVSGWRGENLDNDQDDRGWVMTFKIPYSSLGKTGKPAEGTIWGLALAVHDRDGLTSSPQPDVVWPETSQFYRPASWGQLHFGMPNYSAQPGNPAGTTTIRNQLNGAFVPDAAVGGTTGNLCPGDSNYIWNEWGNDNFGSAADLNIQNQSDIADWPCFAKYYVNFPLDQVPSGKVIQSAKLILHQWGNSGTLALATPSYIQVSTVKEDWQEGTITWNNAPLAFENISQAWIDPVNCEGGSGLLWPCIPREWDVTGAVSEAYKTNNLLRLVLYSSDSDYHSGKLFSTSNTGDWNETGRPTLVITWGNP